MNTITAAEPSKPPRRVLYTSFVNVGCRASTMGSRFLAMIFLTRYLPPSAIGVYGLFLATISYAIFALGMEFYTFNTREILRRPPFETAICIRDQFAFQSLAYLVGIPLLSLLFVFHYLPRQYVGWFFALLVLEHLNREIYRILVATMQPVKGTILLFIGTGLWPWVIVPGMMLHESWRDIRLVWMGWTAGDVLALLLAAWWLRKLEWRKAFSVPVDWRWARKGFAISLVLLIASLALSAITTLDRYSIQHYLGLSMVGVYVFYANIAFAVYSFMESGVISVQFPRIVYALQHDDMPGYRASLRMMGLGILGGTSILCIISLSCIGFVVRFLHKQTYAGHIGAYRIMLAMIAVWLLSLVPHFALYARRNDKSIAFCNAAALATALVAFAFFIPRWGVAGCAMSTLSAMVVVLLLKTCFAVHAERQAAASLSAHSV